MTLHGITMKSRYKAQRSNPKSNKSDTFIFRHLIVNFFCSEMIPLKDQLIKIGAFKVVLITRLHCKKYPAHLDLSVLLSSPGNPACLLPLVMEPSLP